MNRLCCPTKYFFVLFWFRKCKIQEIYHLCLPVINFCYHVLFSSYPLFLFVEPVDSQQEFSLKTIRNKISINTVNTTYEQYLSWKAVVSIPTGLVTLGYCWNDNKASKHHPIHPVFILLKLSRGSCSVLSKSSYFASSLFQVPPFYICLYLAKSISFKTQKYSIVKGNV